MAVANPDYDGMPPKPKSTATTNDSGSVYANDDDFDPRRSSNSGYPQSADGSPFTTSPWSSQKTESPFTKSSCTVNTPVMSFPDESHESNGLIGSLVREEGHIYSLAASGGLLYTGSDSKNIRVWKNQKEFGGFKSSSGLVKAIIMAGDRIFSGHQDGKIRVWKMSLKNAAVHKRIGSLPTTRNLLRCSLNPANYVEARRHHSALWIKHHDAVSCLSLDEGQGLLYSGSWDKTVKVWRVSDSKCLESIIAHDDTVNAVVAGFDGLVFTGSADGMVKVWQRKMQRKGTKHTLLETLLSLDCAVTALAVDPSLTVLYGGSSDGIVNVWFRGKVLFHGGVLREHKVAVLCLATAGCLMFSGSADKSIRVWRRDGASHSCLSVLNGHTGPVKCIAVEPDAESSPSNRRWVLYTGSLDKSVNMWRVSEATTKLSQPPNLAPPPPEPTPMSTPIRSRIGMGQSVEWAYSQPKSGFDPSESGFEADP